MLPAKRQISTQRLSIHAGLRDRLLVALDQVIAQAMQIAVVAGKRVQRGLVLNDIGIILVLKSPMRQGLDILPEGHLERPAGSLWVGDGFRQRLGLFRRFQDRFDLGLDPARFVGLAGMFNQRRQPIFQVFFFCSSDQPASKAARQGDFPQHLPGIEQREDVQRGLVSVMVVRGVEV